MLGELLATLRDRRARRAVAHLPERLLRDIGHEAGDGPVAPVAGMIHALDPRLMCHLHDPEQAPVPDTAWPSPSRPRLARSIPAPVSR